MINTLRQAAIVSLCWLALLPVATFAGAPRVALHEALLKPAADALSVRFADQQYYFDPQPYLDNTQIETITFQTQPGQANTDVVILVLTEEGAQRNQVIGYRNVGKRVALVIEGVVMALPMASTLQGRSLTIYLPVMQ